MWLEAVYRGLLHECWLAAQWKYLVSNVPWRKQYLAVLDFAVVLVYWRGLLQLGGRCLRRYQEEHVSLVWRGQ
jgi:hypothetical protein